jgi:hypothetical protein
MPKTTTQFRLNPIWGLCALIKYDGTLPINIDGHRRNTLVHQFQAWKGTEYIPEHMHPAIHWTKSNPFVLEEAQDTEWHVPK